MAKETDWDSVRFKLLEKRKHWYIGLAKQLV